LNDKFFYNQSYDNLFRSLLSQTEIACRILLLPDVQSRILALIDYLVILTNRIQQAFLKKVSAVAVFLDIANAFDNPQFDYLQYLRPTG